MTADSIFEPGTFQYEAGVPTTTASRSVIDAPNLKFNIHCLNMKWKWVQPLTKWRKDDAIYSKQKRKEFAMTMYTKSTLVGFVCAVAAQANFTIPSSLLANLPTFRSWPPWATESQPQHQNHNLHTNSNDSRSFIFQELSAHSRVEDSQDQ